MNSYVTQFFRLAPGFVAAIVLSACTVGPNYVRPNIATPANFKETPGWKQATPSDEQIRGDWWSIFNDARLNELQQSVDVSNQNIAAAAARIAQARALVRSARAAYFPTITAGGSVTRTQSSSTQNSARAASVPVVTDYSLPIDLSWELDIWGKVHRSEEANVASAAASVADLEAVRLSTHADIAANYVQLRALDTQQQLFNETIAAFEKSLQLTKNRYAAGVVARADVVQAENQLKSTQAQAIDLGVQRAQLEHAIAVLIGKPPSTFSVAAAPLAIEVPQIPPGLPSALLERRPDIAAAERRVAAANAQIGVAEAAYYPSLTLSASTGFSSSSIADLLTLPSHFWSIGPALTQLVIDGGARKAASEQAKAAYDETIANYKQTVLTGFQEVEDNLAAMRILEQEYQLQSEAVDAAKQSVLLTTNQYKAGTVTYLDVIATQTAELTARRAGVVIQSNRLGAAVQLIRALGGSWRSESLNAATTAQ